MFMSKENFLPGGTQALHSQKSRMETETKEQNTNPMTNSLEISTYYYDHSNHRCLDATIKTQSITARAQCLPQSPSSYCSIAGPKYFNIAKTQGKKTLKTAFMNMIEFLKVQINKSLKEFCENLNKQWRETNKYCSKPEIGNRIQKKP